MSGDGGGECHAIRHNTIRDRSYFGTPFEQSVAVTAAAAAAAATALLGDFGEAHNILSMSHRMGCPLFIPIFLSLSLRCHGELFRDNDEGAVPRRPIEKVNLLSSLFAPSLPKEKWAVRAARSAPRCSRERVRSSSDSTDSSAAAQLCPKPPDPAPWICSN